MTTNKKERESQNNPASAYKQGNMHSIKKGTSTKVNWYAQTFEEADEEGTIQPVLKIDTGEERGNHKESANQHSAHVESQQSYHGKTAVYGTDPGKEPPGKDIKSNTRQNNKNIGPGGM